MVTTMNWSILQSKRFANSSGMARIRDSLQYYEVELTLYVQQPDPFDGDSWTNWKPFQWNRNKKFMFTLILFNFKMLNGLNNMLTQAKCQREEMKKKIPEWSLIPSLQLIHVSLLVMDKDYLYTNHVIPFDFSPVKYPNSGKFFIRIWCNWIWILYSFMVVQSLHLMNTD